MPLNTGITVANNGNAKGADLLGTVTQHTSNVGVSPGTRVNCFRRANCGFSTHRSTVSFVRSNYRCDVARVQDVLTSVKVKPHSLTGSINILSKNRIVGLLLTGVLLNECGVLLVSRPKGCLSVGDTRTLRRVVDTCTKAVIFISRSGELIRGITSVVCRVGSAGLIGVFRHRWPWVDEVCSRGKSGEPQEKNTSEPYQHSP